MVARPAAVQALAEACAQVGLEARGAEILYMRSNAVYRLADPSVVVRLRYTSRSAERLAQLAASVQVTAWLNRIGFPAVSPIDVRQPIPAHGYIATFWHYVSEVKRKTDDIAVLAELVRDLHSLPAPQVQLPATNPLGSLREDINRCAWLTDTQRSWLVSRCDELEGEYGEASWTLGCGLLHGDAYTDNLIHTRDGAVLADWDSVSYGPREQDVVPTRMRFRFGEPHSRWERFCQVYGVDPQTLSGLPVLLQMRELRTLTPYLRSDHSAGQDEVGRRIADLMSGNQESLWTALNLAD